LQRCASNDGGPARGRRATENDDRNKEIRDWARERNLDVNDHGRIPGDFVAQFEAANGR